MKSLDEITRINRQAALERSWLGVPVSFTFLSGRTEIGKVTIVEARSRNAWVTFADDTGISVPISKLVPVIHRTIPQPGLWQRVKTWIYAERGNH